MIVGVSGSPITAELYDSFLGKWSALSQLGHGRILHAAGLLADGRVMVAGGIDANGNPLGTEIYDRSLDRWTASQLAVPRSLITMVVLADGRQLLVGGFTSGPSGATVAVDQS